MDSSEAFEIVEKEIKALGNEEYTQLNSVIELVQRYGKEEFSNLDSFLAIDCIKYSKDKARIYKEHDIDDTDRFNFFESISDKWYRENFHSDVLYTILNPNTKEIGRKDFLQEFVKFLEIEDRFDCNKDFEVIKEHPTGLVFWIEEDGQKREKKGYIDLLIKNDTQAIIIENKINYAPDMENQLVRYMKYVHEELNKEISAVVYLTLINDSNKKPPLESYDESFKNYKELLKNTRILKEIYAVDEQKSLAKDFLPACIKRFESENTPNQKLSDPCTIAKVYIDQYKTLLEHLGGKAYMMSTEKKLIEEIYSNKEKYESATDFFNLWWQRRDEALKEILKEKFSKVSKEKFSNRVLPAKTNINGYDAFYWETGKKDCLVYWTGFNEVGFTSLNGEKISPKRQDELYEKIHQIQNREGEDKTETWVYCKIIKDSPTFIDDVMNALEILFNA